MSTLKVDADGTKMWYENGVPHRLDSQAVEYANGTKQWWVNGQRIVTPKLQKI